MKRVEEKGNGGKKQLIEEGVMKKSGRKRKGEERIRSTWRWPSKEEEILAFPNVERTLHSRDREEAIYYL